MVLEIFSFRATELLFNFFRKNSLKSPSQTSYNFRSVITVEQQNRAVKQDVNSHKNKGKPHSKKKWWYRCKLRTHKPSNNACCGVEKGDGWAPQSYWPLMPSYLILLILGCSFSLSLQLSLVLQFSCHGIKIINLHIWPDAHILDKKTSDIIHELIYVLESHPQVK